jgi:DNA primase
MAYDRDEVLARTDLGALADEVLGPRRGRGRSATWPCPDPAHGSQTGRTPPVSLFRSPAGQERWRCHACSAGGTAADLVMTTQGIGFGQAIGLLAARAGVGERDDGHRPLRPAVIERRPEPASRAPSPEIEAHVAACEGYLWSPAGGPMRRWLAGRGLGEEVLRANRVGADPGPQAMRRPAGLPRSGPAVILPVLDPDGRAVYLQARYLHPPSGRKYDNPAARLAGPSPRLADVRLSRSPVAPESVLICEGLPDALVAAQAGHRATALLGAGLPDDRVATALVQRFGAERLVVALDADARGRAGAARLVELLDAAGAGGRVAVAAVPPAWGDLNGWHLGAGADFERQLVASVDEARVKDAAGMAAPEPRLQIATDLGDQLEAIHYRYVLVDDPVLASRNLGRIRREVARWERSGTAPGPSEPTTRRSRLEQDLDEFAYQHLMGDATELEPALAAVKAAVAEWSSGLGTERSVGDGRLTARRGALGVTAGPARVGGMPLDRGLGIDL